MGALKGAAIAAAANANGKRPMGAGASTGAGAGAASASRAQSKAAKKLRREPRRVEYEEEREMAPPQSSAVAEDW